MSKQAHARQHRHRHLPLRLLSAGLLVAALPAAQAVEMTAGDWKIDVGGYINAYYTSVSCGSQTVGGLALPAARWAAAANPAAPRSATACCPTRW